MKKFTDFSDQVTFVSSQIIGMDFSDRKSFELGGKTYKVTDKQYNQLTASGADAKSLLTQWGYIKKSESGQKPQQDNKNSGTDFYNNLKNATETQKSAEKEWGKDSPEAELARDYRNVVFDRARTNVETSALQSKIDNLKLESEKAKLEKKQAVKEAGGRINYATGSLLEKISNSKAGKKNKLKPFYNTSFTSDVKIGGETQTVATPRTSTLTYLADNGDKVAKAAGEVVTTAAKTAGNAALRMTGFKESKETEDIRKSLKSAKSELKEANKKGAKFNSWRMSKKVDKLNTKLKDSEKNDKFAHVRKVSDTVGTGVTVAKTAISSKARENVVKQEGVEGLQQKQAKLLYLLGDRSKSTKIAVGDTKGLGLIDKAKSKVFQHRINRNQRRYQESLNAQYQPAPRYVQYQYPQAVGFSEEQINALNGILSKDFSEGAEVFEGLNLSWQPEEYAKLNSILETDFETLDAQVAESQPDMSEKKVEDKVDNQQVEDSQSGEIDVSDTIDYDNLDPDTLTALVDKSYYEAPDEEKRYQEMIAKGFAEKESSYNNFLESMSDFVDQSL